MAAVTSGGVLVAAGVLAPADTLDGAKAKFIVSVSSYTCAQGCALKTIYAWMCFPAVGL